LFKNVQDLVYNLIPTYSHNMPTWHKIEAEIGHYPYIIGDHYFTPKDGAIAPVFDFRARSELGKPDAFTIGKKVGVSAPSRYAEWSRELITIGSGYPLARGL
jgi:hypothetical protein